MNTGCLAAEILELIEVRSARFIESDDLTINDGAFGEFGKGLDDEWVVVIEGFATPRKQVNAPIRFERDSAVAIELDFLCNIRRYVALEVRFLARDTYERSPTPHNSYQGLRRNCDSALQLWENRPAGLQFASALAVISRSSSAYRRRRWALRVVTAVPLKANRDLDFAKLERDLFWVFLDRRPECEEQECRSRVC